MRRRFGELPVMGREPPRAWPGFEPRRELKGSSSCCRVREAEEEVMLSRLIAISLILIVVASLTQS